MIKSIKNVLVIKYYSRRNHTKIKTYNYLVFRVTRDMIECVNGIAQTEKGSGCSDAQVERVLHHLGPVMQRGLALPYNPADCKLF